MKKLMTYSLLLGAGFSSISSNNVASEMVQGETVGATQGLSTDFSQKLTHGEFSATIQQQNNVLSILIDLPGLDISRMKVGIVPLEDQGSTHYALVGIEEPRENVPAVNNLPKVAQDAVELAQETLNHQPAVATPQELNDPDRLVGFELRLPKNVLTDSMQVEHRSQAINVTFTVIISDDVSADVEQPVYDVEGGVMVGTVDSSLIPADQPAVAPVGDGAPSAVVVDDQTAVVPAADSTVNAPAMPADFAAPSDVVAVPAVDQTSAATVAITSPVPVNVTVDAPAPSDSTATDVSDVTATPADVNAPVVATEDVTPVDATVAAPDVVTAPEADQTSTTQAAASVDITSPVPVDVTVDAPSADGDIVGQ